MWVAPRSNEASAGGLPVDVELSPEAMSSDAAAEEWRLALIDVSKRVSDRVRIAAGMERFFCFFCTSMIHAIFVFLCVGPVRFFFNIYSSKYISCDLI